MEVFHQQEREGIIERFEVVLEDFTKHIWIPHRPVFKTDEQTTTKIRPVFHCFLKANGKYSLNEAAYPGINLMGNMLESLLLFRTNKYVMLAYIRKACLMIKLESLEDRNRFCFFKLVCFRYTTIIFGFNVSLFILNFIIKHHASSPPITVLISFLKFYVDNLIKTGILLVFYQIYTQGLISVWKKVILTLDRGTRIVESLKN